jgi:hypothetical protein
LIKHPIIPKIILHDNKSRLWVEWKFKIGKVWHSENVAEYYWDDQSVWLFGGYDNKRCKSREKAKKHFKPFLKEQKLEYTIRETKLTTMVDRTYIRISLDQIGDYCIGEIKEYSVYDIEKSRVKTTYYIYPFIKGELLNCITPFGSREEALQELLDIAIPHEEPKK